MSIVVASARRSTGKHGLQVLRGGKRSDPPAGPSDDELCDGLAEGDTTLAATLYDRLVGVVDGTLCRILGGRDSDHDDLVQSAFEQILLTLTRGRFARRCSLASWAARISTHVGLNAIRSRSRERRVVDRRQDPTVALERAHHHGDVEAQVSSQQQLDRVRWHLSAMDERKASALFLHDALGHDLGEVAELTGVSVAAAQSRLVRGRKELQRRLAADERADDDREEEP